MMQKTKENFLSLLGYLLLPFYPIMLDRFPKMLHYKHHPYRARPLAKVAFKSFSEILGCSGPIFFSASQSGEDLIVSYIFKNRGINLPTYLDIGAHHPIRFSNTALFYAMGSRGINVEPNPKAFPEFKAMRPDDINLSFAVGDKEEEVTLYIPAEEDSLASVYSGNNKVTSSTEVLVPMVKLTTILDNYTNGKFPDFLSLDVEGSDYCILRQIPFEFSKPKVICVETISYSTSGKGVKDSRIADLLLSNGYILYADTNINSIFVDNKFWIIN